MNIDGLGKKVVENFWDLNLIRFPQDIYNLDYNKISKFRRLGRSFSFKFKIFNRSIKKSFFR